MTTKRDGGFAFPQPIAVGPAGDVYFADQYGAGGMALRDWFAGQALAGLLPACSDLESGLNSKALAAKSYDIADALLTVRDAKPAEPCGTCGGSGFRDVRHSDEFCKTCDGDGLVRCDIDTCAGPCAPCPDCTTAPAGEEPKR